LEAASFLRVRTDQNMEILALVGILCALEVRMDSTVPTKCHLFEFWSVLILLQKWSETDQIADFAVLVGYVVALVDLLQGNTTDQKVNYQIWVGIFRFQNGKMNTIIPTHF